MNLVTGTSIGPYVVTSLLGSGGMGEVYRARDTRLGRDVALKVLPFLVAGDPDRLQRFEREARTLAALNHPHIAQIYGFERPGPGGAGVSALAMELVEGEDLTERIALGPLPAEDALSMARQIADALHAAHQAGIIHRDLKPSNIRVRADGTLKVLDFGLAKPGVPSPGSDTAQAQMNVPTITGPMTQQGVILGTAAYMAPEQARGRPADHRADIWAFGCVLYEMLTGRRAFDGGSVSETLAAVLRGEPDWTALPRDLQPSVATLLRRCLERDPARRVSDTGTVLFVLDEAPSLAAPVPAAAALEVRPGSPVPARPTDDRRARLRLLSAFAAGAIVVAVSGLLWTRSRAAPAPGPVVRFSVPIPEGLTNAINRRSVSISPDGRYLVYAAADRLLIRALDDFDTRATPAHELGELLATPAFSPDGQWIATASLTESMIRRVGVDGGGSSPVCAVAAPSSVTWGTSGLLLSQGGDGILRCPASGGAAERLVTVGAGDEAVGAQLLPDGRTLLFTVARTADGNARWDKARIVAQTPGSSEQRTLISNGADARYVESGHIVYALGGNLYAVPFDPVRLEVHGDPSVVLEGVRRSVVIGGTGIAQFDVSASGTLVFIPGPPGPHIEERAVATADRSGVVTRLDIRPAEYSYVRVSRDGSRLALVTDDGRSAMIGIYEMNASGPPQPLTLPGRNTAPVWAPDGQSLAVQSDREGDLAIYRQRIDGTGTAVRLTTPAAGEVHVPESWSPDGGSLSFTSIKDGRCSLMILSLADGTIAPFGNAQSEEMLNSVFSPDGKWIAYAIGSARALQSPDRGVYVQPFPATGAVYQVPRVRIDFHPVWTANGNELIFVTSAMYGRHAAVRVTASQGLTFGTPTEFDAKVTDARRTPDPRAHDILPDGRLIGLINATPTTSSGLEVPEIRVVLNWQEELKRRSPVTR